MLLDHRLGAALRAVRIRQGKRQSDVATAAGVAQQTVSLLERGDLEGFTVRVLRAIASALGVRIVVEAQWRGGELDRLLDRDHASLVEALIRRLGDAGWEVEAEFDLGVAGVGPIDILAWHPPTRTLLVIEVKTVLADVQRLIGRFATKSRLAAAAYRRRTGRLPAQVGRLVVLSRTSTNQRRITEHRATFRAAFAARGAAVSQWLRRPSGPFSGMLFVPLGSASEGSRRRAIAGRQRVHAARHPVDRGR